MSLVIHLPPREDQTAFNREVWERLSADPGLAKTEGRIETDRHGKIIMTPPPGYLHGSRQTTIGYELRERLGKHVASECPVSTSDGVKGVDVIWISAARRAAVLRGQLLTAAPEICVEVLSPSNSAGEIGEKIALYFDAGATEVWICDLEGAMRFHGPAGPLEGSALCPDFPPRIEE